MQGRNHVFIKYVPDLHDEQVTSEGGFVKVTCILIHVYII